MINKNLLEKLPKAKWLVHSPGRVNLLGEHVDYNDGMVLPAAIDRYVHMAAAQREDGILNISALALGETTSFAISNVGEKVDINGKPLPLWALYPAGVCWALQEEGFSPCGFDAVFSSNIPIGAGLSSSAAVELAFAAMWQQLGEWRIDRMRLAKICRRAENEYVGVNCGLMDQFACAHGVARHVLYFDTRNLAWQPIPLPRNTSIVIADSGMRRELSASDYNIRLRECEDALSIIKEHDPSIDSLRDVSPALLMQLSEKIPIVSIKRASHVVEEIERVKKGCQLLFSGDAAGFGRLMVASHVSLRDQYAVSIPELDLLAAIALSLPGCHGARLTGAGFGGCTVNLVESEAVEAFCHSIVGAYETKSGMEAKVYICKPSRGVHVEILK